MTKFKYGNPNSITKAKLSEYTYKKVSEDVSAREVSAIITALGEELQDFLLSGRELNIRNFVKMQLKKRCPKKFYDITTRQMRDGIPYNIYDCKISSTLRKFIKAYIDNEAMYEKYYNIKKSND